MMRTTPHDAEAQAAAAAHLPGASQMLNATGLSQLLDREVIITHVRIKPGRSVVVAHREAHTPADTCSGGPGPAGDTGENSIGWTMLTTDADKFRKAQVRAEGAGEVLTLHRASATVSAASDPVMDTADTLLFSGPLWADPALSKHILEARTALGDSVPWQVLRYNPRRRVVAAVDVGHSPKVVRVTPEGGRHTMKTAQYWRAQGLPVTSLRALGSRQSATLAPLWGSGDLTAMPDTSAAHTAGSVIAKLHSLPPRREQALCPPANPQRAALGIAATAPWAGERSHALAQELAERLSALRGDTDCEIHGDLSPDQILMAAPASHKVRLIDFDRAGLGDPMRDVGSWAAACRRDGLTALIEPFMVGYASAAPLDLPAAYLWEAYAHLTGAVGYFRHREPRWAERTVEALDLTQEALNR